MLTTSFHHQAGLGYLKPSVSDSQTANKFIQPVFAGDAFASDTQPTDSFKVREIKNPLVRLKAQWLMHEMTLDAENVEGWIAPSGRRFDESREKLFNYLKKEAGLKDEQQVQWIPKPNTFKNQFFTDFKFKDLEIVPPSVRDIEPFMNRVFGGRGQSQSSEMIQKYFQADKLGSVERLNMKGVDFINCRFENTTILAPDMAKASISQTNFKNSQIIMPKIDDLTILFCHPDNTEEYLIEPTETISSNV